MTAAENKFGGETYWQTPLPKGVGVELGCMAIIENLMDIPPTPTGAEKLSPEAKQRIAQWVLARYGKAP